LNKYLKLIIKNLYIWLILISLIVARYYATRPVYKNGDVVRITATVYSDPINYGSCLYLKIAGIKIYLPAFSDVSYGDRVTIEGTVNGDKLSSPKLINVSASKGPTSIFRKNIIDFYQKVLPQPESGLIAGITLGSKGALTSSFYNQTKLAGVAHVIVASGTNITFVVSFLFAVLTLFLSRRRAIVFVILGIILYLFISGFDAPLIRAAIMSSFLFLGQEVGRLVSRWRIFFLTGALMLIYNPEWIGDVGFFLSFVSTASLMLFENRIRNRLKKVPEILKEGLSTSLAAQIGVAPILFVTFGQFNLLSPLINALVLWTVPYIMIFGVIGGIFGLFIPLIGKLVLFICYPLTWWFVKVVEIFS
jgi:competence protein ComEC